MPYCYKLIFILLLSFFTSCSAQQKVLTKEQDKSLENRLNRAKEFFVNGKIAELKGDFNEAVSNFQLALNYDNSSGIYYSLAKNFLRLNKLAWALNNSKTCVNLDPQNSDYYLLLANIYSLSNLPDSAEITYKKVLSFEADNLTVLYALASIYETEKPIQALETYKKLIDLTGADWSLLVKIADLNERLGKAAETVKTVESLIKLNPSNNDLKKMLIEAYVRIDSLDKAQNLIIDLKQLFPNDLQLTEYSAKIFIKKDNWVKGAAEYYKIIDSDEIEFESKFTICNIFLNKSLEDTTLKTVSKKLLLRLDQDSTRWQVKFFLGNLEVQSRNDTSAIKYYSIASDLAPWNSEIWIRLGGLLFEKGKFADTIEKMSLAVQKFPDDYFVNFILGLAFTQSEKFTEGVVYLKKAVQLQSNEINSLTAYAFCLNKLGKFDEAITYYNIALKLEPNNLQIYGSLGLMYDDNKMYLECDEAYTKALSIDSTDVNILNNYAYSLSERGIQLERALKMSKKAIEQEPENSSYLDTYGWICYMMGDYNQALKYIKKAAEKADATANILEHLGDVYFKLANKKKAKEIWQKSFEKDGKNLKLKEKIEKGEL